jgi:amidophosphoribosyltransferase
MSDALKHECGIALIRLLKPLNLQREIWNHFTESKMYLLMEKQHNRGKMVQVLQV